MRIGVFIRLFVGEGGREEDRVLVWAGLVGGGDGRVIFGGGGVVWGGLDFGGGLRWGLM